MFNTEDITVLFAGAGCGKTSYMVERVKKELNVFLPEQIAFVSFTKKGASEGREKVIRKLHVDEDRLQYFKTFHALTFSAMGYKYVNIFSNARMRQFNKLLGFNLSGNSEDGNNTEDDKLLTRYDKIRNGVSNFIDDAGYDEDRYERFVHAYESYKSVNNLIDFQDCLINFVKRGTPLPVKVAFLDEAQDFTILQWHVAETAFADCEKIYVAGDDYQSIYTYAGARPDVLIALANKHKVVKLEVSYRIPRKVYALAKGITDFIGEKMDKDYVPYKDMDGKVETVTDRDYLVSLIGNSTDSWLVLFRNNYTIPAFAKRLQQECIPYHDANGFVVGEALLARIRKYLNFQKVGYRSAAALEEFKLQYNIKDIKDDFTESMLIDADQAQMAFNYVEKFGIEELSKLAKEKPRVTVATIHKVKGAEAFNVAVFMDCSRRVARNKFDNLDSELRLLYVAFTRSQENLYLIQSESSYGYDEIVSNIREFNGI